jgi:hypothetical protein
MKHFGDKSEFRQISNIFHGIEEVLKSQENIKEDILHQILGNNIQHKTLNIFKKYINVMGEIK